MADNGRIRSVIVQPRPQKSDRRGPAREGPTIGSRCAPGAAGGTRSRPCPPCLECCSFEARPHPQVQAHLSISSGKRWIEDLADDGQDLNKINWSVELRCSRVDPRIPLTFFRHQAPGTPVLSTLAV